MKIVVDDKIPFIDSALAALQAKLAALGREPLEVVKLPGSAIGRKDVEDAHVLVVRTRTRCDAALLEGSCVRLVVTATIGYDHIDTDYLERAGIAWTNCPGCNATSVAQYVGSCLLLLQKERGMRLEDMTLGVVGVGHVGTAVVATAKALGVGRILLNDPPREEEENKVAVIQRHTEPTDGKGQTTNGNGQTSDGKEKITDGKGQTTGWSTLEEVLRESNVITVHTPLTSGGRYPTLHLINHESIALMRRRPVVINAARGGVVDEAALERALDAGKVRAAIIDTWENEPHISPLLLEKAYIATPHIAGYSADGKANATRMSMEAVAHYLGLEMDFNVEVPALTMGYAAAAGLEGFTPPPTDANALALWLYNPHVDSRRLKVSRESFETLRGHYPLRREVLELV